MTQEQQDKLRRALYNAKFTTNAEDKNPFVGIYFDDLLTIIENYVEPPIYHEGWLAGEANLTKEYKNIQWINRIPVEKELPKENGKTQQSVSVWATDGLTSGEFRYNFDTKTRTDMWGDPFDITHWMLLPQPPREEE